MNYQDIRCEHRAGVVLITLDRPGRRNAYTPDMGEELVHALRAAATDEGVSAAVITGAGEGFCGGADLDYLGGKRSRNGLALGEEAFINSFTEEFAALPIVTIAAINGAAAGIGITGMLAADMRIVAEDARLVLNFAELGIVPAMGATWYLPRLVGDARARELLLLRREVNGAEAARMGLANLALPAGEVLDTALELAAAAAACKPGLVDAIKRGLQAGSASTLAEALALERALNKELRQ